MRTLLVYVLALLLVGGLLFLAASFAFGRDEEMAPALPGGTPVELPDDRPATGADLRALRLAVVLRGYRMEEVDWVLDQLAEQVDARDREIARLRSVLHVEPLPDPGAAPADEDTERLATPDEPVPIPTGSRWAPAPERADAPERGDTPVRNNAPVRVEPAFRQGRARRSEDPAGDEPGPDDDPARDGRADDPVRERRPGPGTDRADEVARERRPGPGSDPVRERRTGPGSDPVRGLRPDGVSDGDER